MIVKKHYCLWQYILGNVNFSSLCDSHHEICSVKSIIASQPEKDDEHIDSTLSSSSSSVLKHQLLQCNEWARLTSTYTDHTQYNTESASHPLSYPSVRRCYYTSVPTNIIQAVVTTHIIEQLNYLWANSPHHIASIYHWRRRYGFHYIDFILGALCTFLSLTIGISWLSAVSLQRHQHRLDPNKRIYLTRKLFAAKVSNWTLCMRALWELECCTPFQI